jgi:hypothetical protein
MTNQHPDPSASTPHSISPASGRFRKEPTTFPPLPADHPLIGRLIIGGRYRIPFSERTEESGATRAPAPPSTGAPVE